MQEFFLNKELLNSNPLGVLVVAQDATELRIVYANDVFNRLIKDENNERNFTDFWPGQSGIELAKILSQDVLPASSVTTFDAISFKLAFQQGLWNGAKVIVIWADDISALTKEQTNLQQAVKDADQLAENKANFLATMSHEMRTPMQAVFGLLELITLEKPPAAVMEMVEIARNSASGMLEILDDILDLAKIDAQKMELDMFEVPVRTLTKGVLEALSVKVRQKSINLIDEIDSDIPSVILGDPKRLRQILLNLTGNALKFTESGEVKVRITQQTQHMPLHPGHINLRFEIIDSGIGMSKEAQGKLFKSFSQADNSTARKYGGTGLGLSICKKLIDVMHGKIGVESELGKGSTFWFEIPTEEINSLTPVLDMPDLRGLSILSVEDHPKGAQEIVQSLRSMGASVESCPTYAEAIELAKRRPFDVGIIDQGLPDGLGLDLIREVMQIRPFMGLFMYTVRNDPGLLHSLQSLGINYVGKPASRLGLGQNVLEAVNKASLFGETISSRRLLIAEDTSSVRDLLMRQLKILGAEADFVGNGEEALAALSTGEYGILFTDLHMPDMDGYALVEHIRNNEKPSGNRMPVIVLTADVQMAQRQIYMAHGFDECLLKPVTLGHFKRLLIRWGLLKEDYQAINVEIAKATTSSDAIDMNAVINQMGTFDHSAKEMLIMFIDMTAPLIKGLNKDKSIKTLAEKAHSLKGAARSACAVKLGDLASTIQDEAEKGFFREDLINEAALEFERVKNEILRLTKD